MKIPDPTVTVKHHYNGKGQVVGTLTTITGPIGKVAPGLLPANGFTKNKHKRG